MTNACSAKRKITQSPSEASTERQGPQALYIVISYFFFPVLGLSGPWLAFFFFFSVLGLSGPWLFFFLSFFLGYRRRVVVLRHQLKWLEPKGCGAFVPHTVWSFAIILHKVSKTFTKQVIDRWNMLQTPNHKTPTSKCVKYSNAN